MMGKTGKNSCKCIIRHVIPGYNDGASVHVSSFSSSFLNNLET